MLTIGKAVFHLAIIRPLDKRLYDSISHVPPIARSAAKASGANCRSALDWVIDQYRVTTDKRSGISSDPNRPGDPEYIVRLVERVVKVSVETVNIVAGLPEMAAY